jgi:ribosomal-protein-alanine N-acetyltransferase
MMARGSSSARSSSGAAREGPRVFIRHPRAADEAEFVRVRTASWETLREWEPTPPGRDEPEPDQSITFERILWSSNTSDSQRFFICLKTADASSTPTPPTGSHAAGVTVANGHAPIIGQVSLNHIGYGALMGATAGYWMSSAYEGKGLMAEALSLALDFAFGNLTLHRVEANIIPRNARSIALVERLGFRFEGVATQLVRINGVWEDHGRYAMLADEWANRQMANLPSGQSSDDRRR